MKYFAQICILPVILIICSLADYCNCSVEIYRASHRQVSVDIPKEQAKSKPRKIVLIAGEPSHGKGYHEWDRVARLLKNCLDDSFQNGEVVTETYFNDWPAEAHVLDDADAVVMLSDGLRTHPLVEPDRAEKIRQLAKRGAGLVFIHYAVAPPDGLEDDFLEWTGGYWDKDHSQNPINTVKVSPTLTGHPICRGWDSYVAEDEFYFAIRFRENDKRLIPIMTAMLPSRNPRKEILAWAVERKDGGRGFAFTGGHFQCNWHIEPFRKMVLNAILWSAKIEVPKNGVQSTVTWKFVSMPYFLNADIAYPQPGWEDTLDYVLKSIKAEGPEFVLVAGGLVMGRWPDKDSIKKYAAIYYPAWIKRMNDHGLAFYTAIGENEIGGSPWDGEKAKLVPTLKKRFQKYMKMPFNGPRRMKGTAFWFIHENILFIAVDVFEKGDQGRGAIVPKVTGKQLEWFNEVISNNPGLEHIVVMGHTPIHGPTKTHGSGGLLMLEKGRESPLWQAMKKHGVDIYLCGDTNAITCTQEDGILQIAHGSLFGYSPRVNYLVATVSRNKIELELKEIDIVNKGNKLRQAGDNSLYETVLITDEMKRRGYISVGKMVVEHK